MLKILLCNLRSHEVVLTLTLRNLKVESTLETPEEHNGTRLGYPWHLSKDLTKPLTLSLSNHFISIGFQFKDGADLEMPL